MGWFNYYGLIVVLLLILPTVIASAKNKDLFVNYYHNRVVEAIENVTRIGCFVLMPFNIPYTYFGFFYENALIVYAVVNFSLTFAYLLLFYLMRNKPGMVRSVLLSVIPSVIFIFSGITLRSIPLIVCSAGFSVTHVLISVMNAKLGEKREKDKIK